MSASLTTKAPLDLLIVIREGDRWKTVRKTVRNGEARTAVWEGTPRETTVARYLNGARVGGTMREGSKIRTWLLNEARSLLARPNTEVR